MDGRRDLTVASASASRYMKITWDISIIDKLVYIVNTVVLVVTALLLLIYIRPVEVRRSTRCHFPAQFTPAFCAYGEAECRSNDARLTRPISDDDRLKRLPNELDLNITYVKTEDLFPKRKIKFSPYVFPEKMFLMAILSVLPYLCWKLVGGSTDGRDCHLINGCNTVLWLVLTKAGAVSVCLLSIWMVIILRVQSHVLANLAIDSINPESVIMLCHYTIRSLGNRIHDYTVQCRFTLMTPTTGIEPGLPYLFTSLLLWLICLSVICFLNGIHTAYLMVFYMNKRNRLSFIRRYVEDTENCTCDQIDKIIGSSGVLVLAVASRQGYSYHVRKALHAYTQRVNKMDDVEVKSEELTTEIM